MDTSVKKKVKLARWALLGLRCVELVVAIGLFVMMILISGVNASTGWIMRVAVSFRLTFYPDNILTKLARYRNSSQWLRYLPFGPTSRW